MPDPGDSVRADGAAAATVDTCRSRAQCAFPHGGHAMPVAHNRILLLGASGLVGSHVLDRLLTDGCQWCVLAPVRRPLPREHPRLQPLVCEPATDAGRAALRHAMGRRGVDAMICCLGSTARAAGSQQAFIAIDRDLVVALAADARAAGARHAIVVSSVGASPAARSFYLRTKGRMEESVAALGFDRCDMLRPGLLLGDRREHRPLEALGQRLLPLLDPLLRGRLARFGSIDAGDVAAAAVALLDVPGAGRFVHERADLHHAARHRNTGT
jgi:uncharacterized protein YbjT (DUF2867 family)